MANRRMFSRRIITSARFLKMPPSTRALYFHLGLEADDDGIVEAFNVMRLTGSTEDDLKILHSKKFITILNEDLISFVNDWQEHNKIRSDRKVDSIYKPLLLQIIPDIKLLESKERSDRVKKYDIGTSQGQPKDSIGKDRLGKDRLSKDSIYNTLYDYYLTLPLKNHRKFTPSMKSSIDKAIKEYGKDIEHFKRMLDRHVIKVESTKHNGQYATKVRELNVFFGQKKVGSTVLICNDYCDDVWEDVKSNTSKGDVDIG